MSSAARQSPGHLVRCGDVSLLVDCGSGSFHGAARAGARVEELDACLVSHLHPDHIADLLPLLFRLRMEAKRSGERSFQVFGPPGTVDYVEALKKLHAPFLEHPNLELTVDEGLEGELRFSGLSVSCFPVAHAITAVGYRFTSDAGGTVVYSGDTGRSAELIRQASGAEILVVEASCPNGKAPDFHLTPETAAEIAAEAKVDTMVLVHLNPEMDRIDLSAECGEKFKGKMMVGRDGLVIRTAEGGVQE